MQLNDNRLVLTPTDLADFLACRHKTTLELQAVHGDRERPHYHEPLADILRQRGMEHEARYVDSLRARGLVVEDLKGHRDVQRTVEAMRRGVDVIVQAPLGSTGGDARWFGFADVLVKVPGASNLGDWHYEAHDTKLARETRAGALLQLSVYTHLLGELQARTPTHFHIVTPAGTHTYRFDDVAAYFRLVVSKLHETTAGALAQAVPTYPDPVEHCGFCRWWQVCNTQRRKDDHLQFVANLGRTHKRELETLGITTKQALAEWTVPEPFRPTHGSRETFVRLQDQAALQVLQANEKSPQYKLLPVEAERGLTRLPAPSAGDLYLDLEGDPFARTAFGGAAGDGSREYLFGLGWIDTSGEFVFRGWWAFTDAEEKAAFEEVMDVIAGVVAIHPDAHVYHYAPYEPSAFKRLAGRYATRQEEMDVLLRAGRMVDLYAVVRESLRAGVESYSIKEMEQFYGFTRDIDLRKAGQERQAIEIALESGDLGAITQDIKDAVEGYNKDDVRSTWALHRWLESIRPADTPRPVIEPGEPTETIGEREARVLALRDRLLSLEQSGFRPAGIVAYLLDWHRRENKAEWWEYFRLKDLDADALLDERKAVSKLEFVESLGPVISEKTGKPTKSVIDRYRYPPQDCDVKDGDKLNLSDGKGWGEVVAVDRLAHTIDVKVGPSRAGVRPASAFAHDVINAPKIEDALYAIGTEIAEGRPAPLAQALLARQPGLVTAMQGPPGTGKTYQGSVMICDLVAAGKTVGVTAHSHAVIANLLKAVRKEATRRGVTVPMLHVKNEDEYGDENPKVVGGTAWHWCSLEPRGFSPGGDSVDVMFVDEAGQMSLANTLACTRNASSMVLLGDPQQLEQPTKGVHPDGTGVSALQHMLGEHKTMPEDRGTFLDTTWRLAPAISTFTSEVFYEGRLKAKPGLEHQVLRGAPGFEGAGLRIVQVDHDGNRNASDEEVTEVVRIVRELLAPGSEWIDEHGTARPLTPADILIVAPYNAQVARIQQHIPNVSVGTVDRFQGQEAPVVIYSMATSRPEDAPRGLGFLYSPNRFNVATSRARCLCIVVANPRLFEPDCQSAPQLLLANAICRYAELAK